MIRAIRTRPFFMVLLIFLVHVFGLIFAFFKFDFLLAFFELLIFQFFFKIFDLYIFNYSLLFSRRWQTEGPKRRERGQEFACAILFFKQLVGHHRIQDQAAVFGFPLALFRSCITLLHCRFIMIQHPERWVTLPTRWAGRQCCQSPPRGTGPLS